MAEDQKIKKWSAYIEIIFGILGISAALTCWFLFRPPILRSLDIYSPGTLFLFGLSVILFASLWLARPYIYTNEPKWLRGLMAVLGISMILMGVIAIHIDCYRIFCLVGDYPGIIVLIEYSLIFVNLITIYLMVIFLWEAVLWILLSVFGNPVSWFKWFVILLALIELILATTALIFNPTALFLIILVILLNGFILLFKGIAGQ